MFVISWILAICKGCKVGAYLSDISGAFDRVFAPYMLAKLYSAGEGSHYLNFLQSYLEPRRGKVVVQGTSSDDIVLEDMLVQVTGLGPCLWNTFFTDVQAPAHSTGVAEAMFADDLNMFQVFARLTPVAEVTRTLAECKKRVHKWGENNRITFDADKEHLIVIHPSEYHGDSFRLLGCMLDLNLTMPTQVEQILGKIRPKSTAILRTGGYYDIPELLLQYRTHVGGLIECHCGGYFHACSSLLDRVDQVQRRFLAKLGPTEQEAFLEFNFALTALRRNVAVLGLLHKRALGKTHRAPEQLLPFYAHQFDTPRGFGHTNQLYGHWLEATHQRRLFGNPIFLMVDIYNNVLQHIVDVPTVSESQSLLARKARQRCVRNDPLWAQSFNRRYRDPDVMSYA